MTYDAENLLYWYPCPCGDKFKIHLEDLWDGEDIADCQSCTLFISVIYEEENLPPLPNDDDDDENTDDGKLEVTSSKEEEKPEGKESPDALAEKVSGLAI